MAAAALQKNLHLPLGLIFQTLKKREKIVIKTTFWAFVTKRQKLLSVKNQSMIENKWFVCFQVHSIHKITLPWLFRIKIWKRERIVIKTTFWAFVKDKSYLASRTNQYLKTNGLCVFKYIILFIKSHLHDYIILKVSSLEREREKNSN